jgi:hypothetical protein
MAAWDDGWETLAFDRDAGRGWKGGSGMRSASERALPRKLWFRPLALGAISLLIGSAAHGQNLDQGKSPAKLFADSCATCHHSTRGLTKGRFRLTLFLFLQDHYSSNSSSAWALASYLESVDSPRRGKSGDKTAKPSPAASHSSRSAFRPPGSVPEH